MRRVCDLIRPRHGGPESGWRGLPFLRDRRGSVAVEFAVLILPFALLLFSILESCISFAAQQMLSNSAEDVARQIRTGQIAGAELTEERIFDELCGRIEIVVADGCPGLKFDLRTFTTFAEAADLRIDYAGTGKNKTLASTNFDFTPGPSLTKNRLRVFYEWPVMTDLLRSSMSTLAGGKTLHFATVTWQNEPFDD